MSPSSFHHMHSGFWDLATNLRSRTGTARPTVASSAPDTSPKRGAAAAGGKGATLVAFTRGTPNTVSTALRLLSRAPPKTDLSPPPRGLAAPLHLTSGLLTA
eukprot:scaffold17384_cov48-Phaeocystis_antarctica.AAC.1